MTVLLTTQYLEEADQLADRIAMLDHGRIVAAARPTSSSRASAARSSGCTSATATVTSAPSATLTILRADQRLRTVEVGTDGSAASVHDLLGTLRPPGAPASRVSVTGRASTTCSCP